MDEIIRLDTKDRKILYELDFDARQSLPQIAKKLGLSTEVVNYRVKKLEEENIITHYQVIVNLSQLNIMQFKICISLQHITSDKLEKIILELKKNKAVKWIAQCRGSWDLIISLETDSIYSIDNLKEEVLSFFESYISEKALSILLEGSTYNRDYIIKNISSPHRTRTIMKKGAAIQIDGLDYDILKQLSEDGRRSVLDIAKNLNSTPRIVAYRIKKLRKNKIILGFKIALNYEKLGILFYKLFIYCDNLKKNRVDLLINYLAQNKNVIHNAKVLSNWDLEPELEVYSENEFNKILTDLKDKFSDIIKSIDTITILKEHKFVYF